jgi:iron(II)-dependent oxidoreductase
MAARLIADERYAFVLLEEAAADIEDRDAEPAWKALRDRMALIPGGLVQVVLADGSVAPVEVPAFHLDRCAVTNRQYRRFVAAGSYDALEIWPREAWPSLMRFTDQAGHPGPRDWRRGEYPPGLADHPVVGLCWHEAAAYARWVGKRLPRAAEWQKAAGWPEHIAGGACSRYPWGDIFDPARANTWASGLGRTAPAGDYPSGATRNGIHQLAGNVWEWLDDPLETIPCRPDEAFQPWRPMRRIAGGAFNTYFAAEAACQFVTGQPELDRCDNVGFRCAVPAARLRPGP